MKLTFGKLTLWFLTAAFFTGTAAAQKKEGQTARPSKSVIFAVIDSGRVIEPIGILNAGRFDVENDEPEDMAAFAVKYYKAGASYPMIFSGVKAGTVTVKKSNIGTDCGGSTAEVTVTPSSSKLSGIVMALASDLKIVPDAKGYRRRPTATERSEIDSMVRAAFKKEGAPQSSLRNLRYHNLTAVDVEGDDLPEFIGTYWIATSLKERQLMFFIAERNRSGALSISYSDHSVVKADDLMSGDIKDLESGIVSELLIDLLDYDNDGVKEIFTVLKAFEGNNYYVYKRDAGKWLKVRETYVYRCAY